jgi:hypothetical protein
MELGDKHHDPAALLPGKKLPMSLHRKTVPLPRLEAVEEKNFDSSVFQSLDNLYWGSVVVKALRY